MPFGGQLEKENRWLKIKGLIPWGSWKASMRNIFHGKGGRGWTGGWWSGYFCWNIWAARVIRKWSGSCRRMCTGRRFVVLKDLWRASSWIRVHWQRFARGWGRSLRKSWKKKPIGCLLEHAFGFYWRTASNHDGCNRGKFSMFVPPHDWWFPDEDGYIRSVRLVLISM